MLFILILIMRQKVIAHKWIFFFESIISINWLYASISKQLWPVVELCQSDVV